MWNMSINHKGTVTIETLRLILRRFDEQDAGDMFRNWAGDAEVCRFLSWGPHTSADASLKRIRYWCTRYQWNNSYVWALEAKGKGCVIGSISVEIADDIGEGCEVGYCLSKEYWNRGVMTEALQAVLHFLFYEVGYRRIQAKHDILNVASGRVMQKAGMQYEKTEYKAGIRKDGTYYDLDVYVKYIE